jgi:cobalt-zinc-cadmium efflux system membrane fusion protein
MSDAKIAAAGIELATAGPVTLRETLLLNGILQPNQEAVVQITPRFPGVIREIRKRVGDKVAAGEVVARIESNQSLTSYELRAPIAGTIIDRQAALGEYASEQKAVFTVADMSTVWADFSVYRRDLAKVSLGDRVIIDPEDGGSPIEAKVTYLSPVGNSDTQSALARVSIANEKMRLRPGLFVIGRLLLAEKPAAVAVKLAALQTIENRIVVFVRSGEKFEIRDVEIGARDAEHAEILFGVLEGDSYAAKNSFVVKAETGKASAAHEH